MQNRCFFPETAAGAGWNFRGIFIMDYSKKKISFASDYLEGAHPAILQRLVETNYLQSAGYGFDTFSDRARELIRKACGVPDADVYFLTGGTQTNAVMIDALLAPYQGVIAADSGHISIHEAGAIEAGGHKVLTLPGENGKINASQIKELMDLFEGDDSREHMVMPGMVYLSQPTEYGTLYTLEELASISEECRKRGLKLYVDGARLAYALAVPSNDVMLPDLARLCDAFYIGGTKCGALFGEAVVIPKKGSIPHLFTMIKQHGALMAKGRLQGLQFEVLFQDGLYFEIGKTAIREADRLRSFLAGHGYELCFGSPTNQVFCVMDNELLKRLGEKIDYSFWARTDETHTLIRLATSWASGPEETTYLMSVLEELQKRG